MNKFTIEYNKHKIEFDRDYGVNKLTGWTYVNHGSVIIQFVPFYKMIWTAIRYKNPVLE